MEPNSTLTRYSIAEYLRWLSEHAGVLRRDMRAGIAASEIERLARCYGVSPPATVYELFSDLNGQQQSKLVALPSPLRGEAGMTLLECEMAFAQASSLLGAEDLYRNSIRRTLRSQEGVRNSFWRERWIPIAEMRKEREHRYQILVVDGDPEGSGTVGQLFHELMVIKGEKEYVQRTLVATSLSAYLHGLVKDLRTGALSFKRGVGLVYD